MSLRPVVVFAVSIAITTSALALQVPPNQTVEAAGPGGSVVSFAATGTGPDDFNGRPESHAVCSPASGSLFPIGKTVVTCSADNTTGTFEVHVVDTRGPALSLPRDFAVPASSASGAVVTFNASANDIVDGSVAVACTPGSGSTFAIGITNVSCTAADAHGNQASGAFSVTVYPPSQPGGTLPDITAEASGPGGAIVTFSGVDSGAADDFNGRPGSSPCSPASGSLFALGNTTVHCGDASFTIHVVDTTAPSLSLPVSLSLQATGPDGAVGNYNATASDLVDGNVAVACTPAPGSTFAVGTTTVACSASDSHGNNATGAFVVTVTSAPSGDTTPPVIAKITATPNVLSPPDHKLVTIAVTVEATDDTDPAPVSRIFDVHANEAIAPGDFAITGPLTVDIRSERNGAGTDRVYTIFVECVDASGNRAVGTVEVRVPHDSSTAPRRRATGH